MTDKMEIEDKIKDHLIYQQGRTGPFDASH